MNNTNKNDNNKIDELLDFNSELKIKKFQVVNKQNSSIQQQYQEQSYKSLNPILFSQELQQEYEEWILNQNMNNSFQQSQLKKQQRCQNIFHEYKQIYNQSIQEEFPLRSTTFFDFQLEDEFNDQQKQNAKLTNQPEYDLEKGLSIDVMSLKKHFQFNNNEDQIIPVMVSVKTLEETKEQKDVDMNVKINNLLNSRPSLDLICVIDTSNSMQGRKIKFVIQALKQLVDMLGENDRLALITFNSHSKQLCNLKTVKESNKQNFLNIIQSIDHSGGTNITQGIRSAFNILSNRKQSNPVTSIFLLSDGQHKLADQQIQNLLSQRYSSLDQECFTIHSFGFGKDHDAQLMTKIAQIKDGNFYYVEKIDQIDEFFVDALSGLFSVVAQDIQIDIQINRENEIFDKFFKSSTVEKTYGPMWKIIKKDSYQIRINQLFSGVSKDFIFEIRIPKSYVQALQDFERNVEIVQAQLSAIPVEAKYTTKVIKMSNLILTLFTSEETVAQDSEINDNVEFNYLRVKSAESIQDAMKYADQNQFDQGQQILSDMIMTVQNSHPNNKEKLEIIKSDLLSSAKNTHFEVYKRSGKSFLTQKSNNNFTQQSSGVKYDDPYRSVTQKAMVASYQSKKLQFIQNN